MRTVTALSVSVFGGRIDKLTQAFVALEERVEDGNKALTKVSDALSGMSESLDVLVSKRLRVGPLHPLPPAGADPPPVPPRGQHGGNPRLRRYHRRDPRPRDHVTLRPQEGAAGYSCVSSQYFLERLKLKFLIMLFWRNDQN